MRSTKRVMKFFSMNRISKSITENYVSSITRTVDNGDVRIFVNGVEKAGKTEFYPVFRVSSMLYKNNKKNEKNQRFSKEIKSKLIACKRII